MSEEKFPHLEKPVEKLNAIEAVRALMKQQSKLDAENKDLEVTYQLLKKDCDEIERSVHDATTLRKEAGAVKAENGALKTTHSDLTSQLEKGGVALERVKQSQQAAKEEHERLKARIADKAAKKAVEVSQQKLTGKTKKVEEAKKRLAELEAKNAAQKARLEELKTRAAQHTPAAAVVAEEAEDEKFTPANNLPVVNEGKNTGEDEALVRPEETPTPAQPSKTQTPPLVSPRNLSVVASVTATLGASAAAVVASTPASDSPLSSTL